MLWPSLYFRHLRESRLTYWAHARRAWGLIFRLCRVQAVLAVHSVYPDWFQTTGTDLLHELAERYAPTTLELDTEDLRVRIKQSAQPPLGTGTVLHHASGTSRGHADDVEGATASASGDDPCVSPASRSVLWPSDKSL